MKKEDLYQVSEVKLIYISKIDASKRPQITTSEDAYAIFIHNWSDQIELVEEFNILLLNRSNKVIGIYKVSKGGTNSTVVDAKIVFTAALKCKASSILLAHNHPSQSIKPSQTDIDLTRKLKKGGEVLDIPVLDHLIISPLTYTSMADENLF